MGELAALFDAFYSRFVLRDLLAKITPGAIVLYTIYITLQPGIVSDILRLSKWTDFWTWIFVATFSWITGFAIQGLGGILHIIRYHPPRVERKLWYEMQIDLPEFHRKNFERFTVIKEACGNGAIALFISSFILLWWKWNDCYSKGLNTGLPWWLLIIVLLSLPFLLSLPLWYMHVAHVLREYDYIQVCLIEFCISECIEWDYLFKCKDVISAYCRDSSISQKIGQMYLTGIVERELSKLAIEGGLKHVGEFYFGPRGLELFQSKIVPRDEMMTKLAEILGLRKDEYDKQVYDFFSEETIVPLISKNGDKILPFTHLIIARCPSCGNISF